jgi:WD40 repeat protein
VNLHVDIPEGAEDRAWEVVRRAYAEREPLPRPRGYVRPVIALAVALAIVAGALTGPGRAVLGGIRQAVGEKNAAPALFALPARGRLIVYSTDGPWIVDRDGSKRLLDRYDELSWSPHGKYVVATRRQELFALEPNGDVHWSLARTGRISVPTWGGTREDTRIAYLGAGPNLRVVGGDGKGDRLVARNVARATPAWLPAAGRHLLAFADRRGGIHLVDVDRPAPLRHAPGGEVPEELKWVADGSALLVISPRSLRILRPDRSLVRRIALPPGPHSVAVSPHTHLFALTRRFGPDRSELLVFDAAHPVKPRRLFAATGSFTGLEWSPDGRWLLLAWPDADQWLFVGTGGKRKVLPVARVAEQFSQTGVFPALGGWCCAQP